MALDPRLSLAFQPMPIQTPDLLRTLLGAENIKASMQQQQLRSLQLAELVKSQEQERQMMDYLRARYAAQQPPGSGLAALVGQAPLAAPSDAGPITQTAFAPPMPTQGSPASGTGSGGMAPDSIEARIAAAQVQRITGQAPSSPVVGVQDTPALTPGELSGAIDLRPEGPARAPGTTPPGPPLPGMAAPAASQAVPTWQEFAQFGKPGRDMHDWVQQGQVREAQMRVHELDRQMKGIDAFERGLDLVSDQRSLDNFKTQLRQVSPALADMLPDTYDADDMKRRREQLIPLKNRLESQRMGLNPIYGTQDGKTAIIFPNQGGGYSQPAFPPGFQAMGPGVTVQKGPTEDVVLDKAGNPVRVIRKDVYGGARQQEEGKQSVDVPVEQLKKLNTAAETARGVHQTLDEVERLIGEGVYEQSPTLGAAIVAYRNTGTVLPSYDKETLARTIRLRELGAQLVLTHGSLGVGVSNEDRRTYQRATGDFESGKTLASMRESIKSMRTIADTAIRKATDAQEQFRATGTGARQQGQPKGFISKAQQADIFASDAFKKSGVTPEQAIAGWRQQGLEVEP